MKKFLKSQPPHVSSLLGLMSANCVEITLGGSCTVRVAKAGFEAALSKVPGAEKHLIELFPMAIAASNAEEIVDGVAVLMCAVVDAVPVAVDAGDLDAVAVL